MNFCHEYITLKKKKNSISRNKKKMRTKKFLVILDSLSLCAGERTLHIIFSARITINFFPPRPVPAEYQ